MSDPIESGFDDPTTPSDAPTHEWWCAKCKERGMPWTHVTYDETHEGCGGTCISVPIEPSDAPTPETDIQAKHWSYRFCDAPDANIYINADFARRLERERNEARAELAKLKTPTPPTEGSAVEWAASHTITTEWGLVLQENRWRELARRADEAEQAAKYWENDSAHWSAQLTTAQARIADLEWVENKLNGRIDGVEAEAGRIAAERDAAQAEARELREALEPLLDAVAEMKRSSTNGGYELPTVAKLDFASITKAANEARSALDKKEGER